MLLRSTSTFLFSILSNYTKTKSLTHPHTKRNEKFPLHPSKREILWWNGFIKALSEAKKDFTQNLSLFQTTCDKAQQFIEKYQSDPNAPAWRKSFIPYQHDLLTELIKQDKLSGQKYFEAINQNIDSIKRSLQAMRKRPITIDILKSHIRNYINIDHDLTQWTTIYGPRLKDHHPPQIPSSSILSSIIEIQPIRVKKP